MDADKSISVEVRPGQLLVCPGCDLGHPVPEGAPGEAVDLVCVRCGRERPVRYLSTAAYPVVAAPLFMADLPLWGQLLVHEMATIRDGAPKGKAGVARDLGFGRAYVSRAIATLEGRSSGFPNGVPQTFIDRVMDRLHVIECPATAQCQPRGECHKGNRAAPTHNPFAMRVWRSCQTCPHKPEKE